MNLAFSQRLRRALDEIRADRLEVMGAGQPAELYQQSVGYLIALRDVQGEIDQILKQMME